MYRAKQKQKKDKKSDTLKNKKADRQLLNRYDFAYAGRVTVNQAAKVTPGIIKGATNEINNIAQQRTDQIISQGGK